MKCRVWSVRCGVWGGVPVAGEWDAYGGAEARGGEERSAPSWGGKSPARGRSAGEFSPLFLLEGDAHIGATLHRVGG